MSLRLGFLLTVVGLVTLLATASVALAQPASLTTETLIASEALEGATSDVSETCNPLGPSTIEFTIAGDAVGPYSGTFTETGRFMLSSPISPVAFFTATFTITSPEGTVTGTKTLEGIAMPGLGICGLAAFGGQHAHAVSLQTDVNYSATITTPSGTATDSGVSNVSIQETQLRGEPVQGNGFSFLETFNSTSFTPGDDDDDDDQGEDETRTKTRVKDAAGMHTRSHASSRSGPSRGLQG